MEMGGLSEEAVDAIVNEAERRAAIAEEAAADQRRRQREQDQIDAAVAVQAAENEAAQVADAPPAVAEAGDAGSDVVSGAEADPLAADADAMGDASGEAAAVE